MTGEPTAQVPKPEGPSVEEVLGAEVIADAERRAERVRRRGQRDAERIRQKAEEQAGQTSEDILTEAQRRAERVSQMVLATVEVEALKVRLALKEEVIGAALEAAWQRLLAKDDYEYVTVLVELAAAAIAQMPGEEFVVQLGDDDTGRSGEEVCRRIEEAVSVGGGRQVRVQLSAEHPRIAAGCVVFSADGRLRYDNSFEARRHRLYQQLRQAAARDLFGTEEPTRDHQ